VKHRERHPVDVPGCFGCKACGLVITVPRRMSAATEDLQAEHMAAVKQHMAENPGKIQPAGSRWI
jgi:hypothetical protein